MHRADHVHDQLCRRAGRRARGRRRRAGPTSWATAAPAVPAARPGRPAAPATRRPARPGRRPRRPPPARRRPGRSGPIARRTAGPGEPGPPAAAAPSPARTTRVTAAPVRSAGAGGRAPSRASSCSPAREDWSGRRCRAGRELTRPTLGSRRVHAAHPRPIGGRRPVVDDRPDAVRASVRGDDHREHAGPDVGADHGADLADAPAGRARDPPAQPVGERVGPLARRPGGARRRRPGGCPPRRPRPPRAGRSPSRRCAPSPAARCARRPAAATASRPAPTRRTPRPRRSGHRAAGARACRRRRRPVEAAARRRGRLGDLVRRPPPRPPRRPRTARRSRAPSRAARSRRPRPGTGDSSAASRADSTVPDSCADRCTETTASQPAVRRALVGREERRRAGPRRGDRRQRRSASATVARRRPRSPSSYDVPPITTCSGTTPTPLPRTSSAGRDAVESVTTATRDCSDMAVRLSAARQAGTTLTSFGARTTTVRTSRPSSARCTASAASASSRSSSSVDVGRHLQPAAHLALHLHDAGHGVLDQQRRVGDRERSS